MDIKIYDITPGLKIIDDSVVIAEVNFFDNIIPLTEKTRKILINDTFFITVIDGGTY